MLEAVCATIYVAVGYATFWVLRHHDDVTWGELVTLGTLFALFWPIVGLTVGVMVLCAARFWDKPVWRKPRELDHKEYEG